MRQAWAVEVGEGYSSPVTAAGRAIVHGRKDPLEIVTAVDVGCGRTLWQQEYEAPSKKNPLAARMANGPYATPLIADGRIFTLGTTGILTAWDLMTGRHLWRKDFSRSVDTSQLFCGTAASPLLAAGLLIVQVGSDIQGGRIIALDPAGGTARWEWRGAGPGYASPTLITVDDTAQMVTLTNRAIVSLDVKTGAELWSTPFKDEWHENISTGIP